MRNGRGIGVRVRRSTMMPAHTITKISSVPMLTSSPSTAMGVTAPSA
ncbi:MAG: hypothetical protein U0P30_00060 [Vicinamibacterales bacterium]